MKTTINYLILNQSCADILISLLKFISEFHYSLYCELWFGMNGWYNHMQVVQGKLFYFTHFFNLDPCNNCCWTIFCRSSSQEKYCFALGVVYHFFDGTFCQRKPGKIQWIVLLRFPQGKSSAVKILREETDRWNSVKMDAHKFGRTSHLDLSVHWDVWWDHFLRVTLSSRRASRLKPT